MPASASKFAYKETNYKFVCTKEYRYRYESPQYKPGAKSKSKKLIPKYGYYDGEYFSIKDGTITAKEGYAWDGPSGPTIDTRNSVRASCIHDIIYQSIKEGILDYNRANRKAADKIFRRLLKEDGMSFIRRLFWYLGTRLFGAKHCKPGPY